MAQYIDKDALVEEIEKKMELGKLKCQQSQENNDYESYVAWSEHIATCGKILLFINTLEVKEVDLNKELSYEDYKSFFEKHSDLSDDWGFDEAWIFAKYFFELGLKVNQKGD